MLGNLELDNYQMVCVDFFDTIVHRVIPPESVKILWSKVICRKLKLLNFDLYNLRFTVEAKLCKENAEVYGELEFKYEDMCRFIYDEIVDKLRISVDEFTILAKRTEIDIEKSVLYVNKNLVKDLFKYHSPDKKIILISDFYFSVDMMHELISYLDLDELFDDIFVSSNFMKSKRSGEMYKHLKIIYPNIFDNSVVMIGDSKHSDVDNARLNGLSVLWNNATALHDYYKNYDEINNVSKIFAHIDSYYLSSSGIIYPEILEALYLFTRKLYDKLMLDGFSEVIFLSREGEFLKKLFDHYSQFLRSSNIKTHYMKVSRRATFLPSLKDIESENFENLFRQYINISRKEFLLNINFSYEQIITLENRFGCDFSERINNLPQSRQFRELIIDNVFKDYYEENRLDQINAIHAYFNTFETNFSRIAIVDVGWKGTIQDNLSKILPNTQIYGYYLGLNFLGNVTTNSVKHSILFDIDNGFNWNSRNSYYNECRSVFETMLAASHGSAGSYTQDGQCLELENESEKQLYTNKICTQQDLMFNYFKMLSGVFHYKEIKMHDIEDKIKDRYANFIFSPNKLQHDFFYSCYHIESFGLHEATCFQTFHSGKPGIISFIFSPKKYISYSMWPVFSMKLDKLSIFIVLYKIYRKMIAK